VFAGRADRSLRALEKVLEILHARLVIQTEEQAREQTSVARAAEALAVATFGNGRYSEWPGFPPVFPRFSDGFSPLRNLSYNSPNTKYRHRHDFG
jgi:hypothetical protein